MTSEDVTRPEETATQTFAQGLENLYDELFAGQQCADQEPGAHDDDLAGGWKVIVQKRTKLTSQSTAAERQRLSRLVE